MTIRDPELPPGLALSWGVEPIGRRGPKPGLTVTRIVAASIELADREGAGALSLPGIARRVGLTTTGLYRYVRSKDELVVLIVDAAWGEPPAKVGRARSWRTASAAWTRGMIDRLAEHPWLLDMPVRGAPTSPNTLRWLEAFLRGMSGSGLDTAECLGCALLLDGYARSTASVARDVRASADPSARPGAVREFLAPRLLADGRYPILAALLDAGAYGQAGDGPDIEFGLNRILDGIGQLVADRAARG